MAEKIRYVAAGVWNTAIGWLIFALIFSWLGDRISLWLVSVFAHLLATTQAFWAQRRFVFRVEGGAVLAQFGKFQLSYLALLATGASMLNALSAQGVPPLLAQVMAMGLLAVCGFVLGKSFTFNPDALNWGSLGRRIGQSWQVNRVPVVFFALSLLLFEAFWGRRFYASVDNVGHDFALSATGLLEGKFWLDANGVMAGLFNPPWFTPAWCGGAAFYADPQAGFYSPLQLIALWVDPFQAMHLSSLLFASLAFWGSYALARKVFGWSAAGATVFAVLGMANAFMPMRSAVGESGYQPLYIWTLLALSLCWPATQESRWRQWFWPSICVAMCLSAWLQFGFAGMMVPVFLATLLLCGALVIMGKATLNLVVGRAALGGVLSVVLNGSKLYESASLMRNFPRDFYGMPGFVSLYDALVSTILALLQPSEWTALFGFRRLSGVQFAVFPHEWALEFGLGAVVVALLFGLAWLRLRERSSTPAEAGLTPVQFAACVGMLVLVVLPPLLLWNHGPVRDALKQIPILNSAAWPMRWIVIYLPMVQFLLALPVERVLARARPSWSWPLGAVAMAVIWAGPATTPVGYYLDAGIQSYDPKPVIRAFQQSRVQGALSIDRIVVPPAQELSPARNDAMLQGASQGLCYNPLYGYRLEAFPQPERLQAGPALAVDASGQSLLRNPACLVHPEVNHCKPGDGFRMDDPAQRQAAQAFLARQPFEWQRPWLGKVLSWVSQLAFWLLMTLVVLRAWQSALQLARPVDDQKP